MRVKGAVGYITGKKRPQKAGIISGKNRLAAPKTGKTAEMDGQYDRSIRKVAERFSILC